MRYTFLSSAIAVGCGLALAIIASDPARAGMRRIGSYTSTSLRGACAAAGGSFGTGQNGEHYCQKGGNLIDFNGKNNCIGGVPRSGGAASGTGGTAITAKAGAANSRPATSTGTMFYRK
jgi:hypothetical protein